MDNRPLSPQPTGSLAAAAFRGSQSEARGPSKRPRQSSPPKEKKRKRQRQPQPPPSPAAAAAEDDVEDATAAASTSSASPTFSLAPSAISAAVSDRFVPAQLAPVSASSLLSPSTSSSAPPSLVLFQFPAKFDVAAFAQLDSLDLPLPSSSGAQQRAATGQAASTSRAMAATHFELHGERFSVVEAEVGEVSDVVCLFPQSASSRGSLLPGRPFARLFQVISEVQRDGSSAHLWMHSAEAVQKKTPKAAKEGLRQHFRPIGYLPRHAGHLSAPPATQPTPWRISLPLTPFLLHPPAH